MRFKPVTPTSLLTMSVDEILGSLYQYVVGDIPEGINDGNDLQQLEYYLGRLGNDYAYIIELLSYSRNYVRRLKRIDEKARYEDMMDIRDALADMASAIKLKYQAVSRQLTTYEQRMDEVDFRDYRKERKERK